MVNAICAKKRKDGYSPYKMIFSSFLKLVSSLTVRKTKVFIFGNGELHQDLDQESRIIEMFTIQPRCEKQCSSVLRILINQYIPDDLIMIRKPFYINKSMLTTKYIGAFNFVAVQNFKC